MTSAGTVTATGITGVEVFRLANGGANTLKLKNSNFTGVSDGFIRVYGGNAGNTVNGAGVTTAADQLVIYGSAAVDHLTGGAGKDIFVFTPTALGATDTVVGGGGTDELLMTAHGTVKAGGVSGVENFVLASGGTNTLALTSANFTGVGGSTITVYDGYSGNTVNASTLPSADKIIVHAGSGTDALTGGAGSDIFFAGGKTTMKGGAGANRFTFADIGSNTITDFGASATNKLVFSNSGFNLGLGGATSTPQALSASLIGSLTNGTFTTGAQRFAYDQSTGRLLFDADGNGSGASHLVATLTLDPALTASRLFFVT
jgi:Ca2+-binding RTX toxin-like protein